MRPSSGHVTPGLWVKLAPKTPQRERLLVWEIKIESIWTHKLPPQQEYKNLMREGKHPLPASSTGSPYGRLKSGHRRGPLTELPYLRTHRWLWGVGFIFRWTYGDKNYTFHSFWRISVDHVEQRAIIKRQSGHGERIIFLLKMCM